MLFVLALFLARYLFLLYYLFFKEQNVNHLFKYSRYYNSNILYYVTLQHSLLSFSDQWNQTTNGFSSSGSVIP